jgi:hypothetical protein
LKTKWLPCIHVVTDQHCLNMNILNTQMHVSYRLVWDYCLFMFILKTHPLPFCPKHAGSYTNWPDMCISRGFEYSCSYIPNVQIEKPSIPVPSWYVQMNISPNTGS